MFFFILFHRHHKQMFELYFYDDVLSDDRCVLFVFFVSLDQKSAKEKKKKTKRFSLFSHLKFTAQNTNEEIC